MQQSNFVTGSLSEMWHVRGASHNSNYHDTGVHPVSHLSQAIFHTGRQDTSNLMKHANDLLIIGAAHLGRIKKIDELPTHPRAPDGTPRPLVDISMGALQAGSDMSTSPVGAQQSAAAGRGYYHFTDIPTSQY